MSPNCRARAAALPVAPACTVAARADHSVAPSARFLSFMGHSSLTGTGPVPIMRPPGAEVFAPFVLRPGHRDHPGRGGRKRQIPNQVTTGRSRPGRAAWEPSERRETNTRTRTMFAVIKTGGKQYRVAAEDRITVERLPGEPGDIVEIGEVLMLGGDSVVVGNPLV